MKTIDIDGHIFPNLKQLGKGTFGTVYKISEDKAIKVIRSDYEDGISSLKEIDVMRRLDHPFLSKAYEVVVGTKGSIQTGLVMDLAFSDLFHAEILKKFSVQSRIKVLWNVTQGLKFLHDSNYIHADIKPLNILLFNNIKNPNAKLTDFGISLILNPKGTKYYPVSLVTISYRPPEILNGGKIYSKSVDIWSLGISFMETLSNGKSPFQNFKAKDYNLENVKKTVKKYFYPKNLDYTLKGFLSNLREPTKSRAISLIKSMLSLDPKKRPTTKEILSHDLFKNVKLKDPRGKRKNPLRYKPRYCDILNYYGFDFLVKLCVSFDVQLETFFLANDIYQRSLAYSTERKPNDEKYLPNVYAQAASSFYMSFKMIEPYYADAGKIARFSGDIFKQSDLIKIEAFLVNVFTGIIYQDNLFTETTTKSKFLKAFEVARNCHFYYKIDLKRWNISDKKTEGEKLNKNMKFSEFIKLTPYFKFMNKDKHIYLPELHKSDKNLSTF